MRVGMRINGQPYEADVEPRTLLIDFIRDIANMKGTHMGCGTGDCGACTVLMDGRPVKSCLVLAAQADGSDIVTVEGLGGDGIAGSVKNALARSLQCGFCAPGMAITATWYLENGGEPTEEGLRNALSGVLCRCTGYQPIIEAIAEEMDHGDR